MKFAVHVTEAAKLDAAKAADWYERQRPGLGDDFRAEAKAAATNLADDALLHATRFRDVRRAGLRRFSNYGLFYVVRENEVIIFAILHGAQNPARVRRRRNHLD